MWRSSRRIVERPAHGREFTRMSPIHSRVFVPPDSRPFVSIRGLPVFALACHYISVHAPGTGAG